MGILSLIIHVTAADSKEPIPQAEVIGVFFPKQDYLQSSVRGITDDAGKIIFSPWLKTPSSVVESSEDILPNQGDWYWRAIAYLDACHEFGQGAHMPAAWKADPLFYVIAKILVMAPGYKIATSTVNYSILSTTLELERSIIDRDGQFKSLKINPLSDLKRFTSSGSIAILGDEFVLADPFNSTDCVKLTQVPIGQWNLYVHEKKHWMPELIEVALIHNNYLISVETGDLTWSVYPALFGGTLGIYDGAEKDIQSPSVAESILRSDIDYVAEPKQNKFYKQLSFGIEIDALTEAILVLEGRDRNQLLQAMMLIIA